jgi:hypothetical protein
LGVVPLLLASENLAPGFLIRGPKGETMTAKEWAARINGIEYPADELAGLNKAMADDGIVIAYGASDDLLEFRGVIYDEAGAWEGTEVRVFSRGEGTAFLFNEDENKESAEFNRKEIVAMPKIRAIFAPRNRDVLDNGDDEMFATWLIETEIPHETFDIMEDGELFCRGVVFQADSVKAAR